MKTYNRPEIKIVEIENEALLQSLSNFNEEGGGSQGAKPGYLNSKKRFNADYMDDDEAFDSFDEF